MVQTKCQSSDILRHWSWKPSLQKDITEPVLMSYATFAVKNALENKIRYDRTLIFLQK